MKNMIHTSMFSVVVLMVLTASSLVFAEPELEPKRMESDLIEVATLRQAVSLKESNENPAMLGNAANTDVKRGRAYPMQPPTIPHKIDGYQIDLFANQCVSCHARDRTAQTQAPMISVTHFMDRDGNFLADVSPRRYFCSQCHVTQIERHPLLENTFKDVTELTSATQSTH